MVIVAINQMEGGSRIMALVRWEPFRELAALQNEMGRWMGQLSGGATPGNGQSSDRKSVV